MTIRAAKLGAALLCWLAVAPATAASAPPIVETASGAVRGTDEDGVLAFRGIPYAAAPIGGLRWRPPQPAMAWDGVRDATRFAADCPGAFPDPTRMAEDCLYLNLWTSGIDAAVKRPVMVWIYGGGFRGGSAAAPLFDGTALARKGVVLVSFGYRTGPLGFLALPELTAESPHHASGNYGILDAIAALQWVRANAAAFGGDPFNVTIFGQSSGSETVNILTASPLAKGLFQRAIGESGSSFGVRRAISLAQAEQAGRQFVERGSATDLARLRAAPWRELQQRDSEKFEPNVDGWILPDEVRTVYRAGMQNDVPMLIGNTGQEFGRPAHETPASLQAGLAREFGDLAPKFGRALAKVDPTDARWELTNAQWGDFPAATWARLQASTGKAPVYRYLFDYAPPASDGGRGFARHGSELGYVFGTYRQAAAPALGLADDRLGEIVSAYWINFARTGDPNGVGLPRWAPVTQAPDSYLRFTANGPTQVPARNQRLVGLLGRHYFGKPENAE